MNQASENYTPGYTPNALDFMSRRTVESHAAFFLPRLQAGMRLLDCGCGPGGITIGLARRVSPGTPGKNTKAALKRLGAACAALQ